MSSQKISISFPSINWQQQPIPITCRRAIRTGGFLLEQQQFNGKHLIHSYGHGGAEFSLSFGNAYLTNKMLTMRQHPTEIHEVAVLGAGITGLVTALQLLKTGYKVRLYAQKFPKYNQKDPKKRIGSQQGLQFWYPSFYDIEDPVRHQFVCKIAYRLFKECLDQNKYRSLKWVNCFISGPQTEQVTQVVSEFITKDFKQVEVDFGNNKPQEYLCFKTFLIDTELFLQEIFIELKLRKVELIQKKFENSEDVASLKQKSVYNCLSYGSNQIFNDKNLYPLVGHYAKLSLDKPVSENYVIWKSSEDEMDDDVVITVAGKTVQVGSNWAKNQESLDVNKERIQKLVLNAEEFIKQRSAQKI